MDTGLQFKVQRRAGSHHADVQPLTRKDTKIMKKIYNGKWSWNRRAIIVLENDQLIAASMHGMPHGAGALQNGFRGHFCVHFYGSITHRKKSEEIAHKLMILKAGGKLADYINSARPEEILPILEVGLNQNDKKLLNMVNTKTDCSNCLDKLAKDISYFKVSNFKEPNELEKLLKVEIPAQVTYISDENGKQNRNIIFSLVREGLMDRWKIEQDSLYNNFERKNYPNCAEVKWCSRTIRNTK